MLRYSRSELVVEQDELVQFLDILSGRAGDGLDDAVLVRLDHVLHLHGDHDHESVALLDRVAHLHVDFVHNARHGRHVLVEIGGGRRAGAAAGARHLAHVLGLHSLVLVQALVDEAAHRRRLAARVDRERELDAIAVDLALVQAVGGVERHQSHLVLLAAAAQSHGHVAVVEKGDAHFEGFTSTKYMTTQLDAQVENIHIYDDSLDLLLKAIS